MDKSSKLKLCNRALLVMTPLMLVSSVWLEATGSRGTAGVWLHIAVGTAFLLLVCRHLRLHFGGQNRLKRFGALKSRATKVLTVLALLTLASTIVATVHWTATFTHSVTGAVHGKIGFLMLALAVGHTVRRFRFFRRRGMRR